MTNSTWTSSLTDRFVCDATKLKRPVTGIRKNLGNAASTPGSAKAPSMRGPLAQAAGNLPRSRSPGASGQWVKGVATGATGVCKYRLYLPGGLRAGQRVPLLMMLHGCGQDASSFAASTRMNRIAEREKFMVLYPEQDRSANSHGCWNWFDTRSGKAYDETALLIAALDEVCRLYPFDGKRAAVAGMSAGASMAGLLAARHPDRFKALVMHSGIPPGAADSLFTALAAMQGHRVSGSLPQPQPPLAESLDPNAAAAAAWVPVMVIHGRHDATVAASNGVAAAKLWASAGDACEGASRELKRGRRYPMTVTDYTCQGLCVARLVDVAQLGHAWSGGAACERFSDAQGPDASRMVWTFASKQFQ